MAMLDTGPEYALESSSASCKRQTKLRKTKEDEANSLHKVLCTNLNLATSHQFGRCISAWRVKITPIRLHWFPWWRKAWHRSGIGSPRNRLLISFVSLGTRTVRSLLSLDQSVHFEHSKHSSGRPPFAAHYLAGSLSGELIDFSRSKASLNWW